MLQKSSPLSFAALLCLAMGLGTGAVAGDRHIVEDGKIVVNVEEESEVDFTQDPIHNYLFDLSEILSIHSDIDTLIVTGEGGYEDIANEYIEFIQENALNTVARGNCFSSCAHMFLAGQDRRFEKGAVLGFHRSWWGEKEMEIYFEKMGGESRFKNQFQFAEHIFEEGQIYTITRMNYFLDMGMSFEFVTEIFTTSSYEMVTLTETEFQEVMGR